MEIASAPTTPENTGSPRVLRRSFTAPIRSTGFSKLTEPFRETEGEGAETLFTHNAGRIVSFNTYPSQERRHSSLGHGIRDQQDEPVGSLPWISTTERTIAAGSTLSVQLISLSLILTHPGFLGPLRIYRVLGSVAFLHSGTTLRPILAKSQCWCVDGESKFVLRIVQNSYYRIELPNSYPEEKGKVQEFKKVLAKVLQYEVTPCPFERGFTVDLPEPPKTPIQKRPWKPKQRVQPVLEQAYRQPQNTNGPAIRHSSPVQFEVTQDDNQNFASKSEPKSAADESKKNFDLSSAESTDHEHDDDGTNDSGINAENLTELFYEDPGTYKTPTRPRSLQTGRAVTAPSQLTLRTASPSIAATIVSIPPEDTKQSLSLSSSEDSFHSFHSPISPLPPSPPYSEPPSPTARSDENVGLGVQRTRSHIRDTSRVTITGDTEFWNPTEAESGQEETSSSSPGPPKTPPLVSDTASEDHWSEPVTPQPSNELRHREKWLTRRPYSPLPSPVNLYSPRNRFSGHHLTTAILQKTCSMLLGPPVQLVALMLNIAAKIANGVHRGASYGYGEAGQKIPCSWDFSDADEESEDMWEEDDYGVSLGESASSKTMKAKETGGSWEID